MAMSWIELYPGYYVQERRLLSQHYPDLIVDESLLRNGQFVLRGLLRLRPPGGTIKIPIALIYPDGAPFEYPIVVPLVALPESGKPPKPLLMDHHHQMPGGALCLFQRESRFTPGGDIINGIKVLRRAEEWLLGHYTGHWPPDTAESELETHFTYAGDALLSEVFFSPGFEGYGRFFLVKDFLRLSAKLVDGPSPRILAALTQEGNVVGFFDARQDISRLFPWIKWDLWSPETLALKSETTDREDELYETGYWWSLPREPRPFHDGRGLLRELQEVAPNGDAWSAVTSLLGTEISLGEYHFIGLRYPARNGEFEWLLIVVERGKRNPIPVINSGHQRNHFERSPVHCLHAYSARPAGLSFRNTGVIKESVSNTSVALIGLGALGSSVALLLGKAGVRRFRLCDKDTLTPSNVSRHVGGVNEFGAPKVHVVIRHLLETNPYIQFNPSDVLNDSAVKSLEALRDFIAPVDLVISTVADESVESVINQVAVICQKPVLYARSLRRANMGRVFLVRPRQDACKACLGHYSTMGRSGGDVPPDWIDVPESESDVLLHECGRPVIAGSGIDMSFVATLTARVALDFFEGSINDRNHWIWSRHPEPGLDPRIDREFCTLPLHLEPLPGCPACQEPQVLRVVMSEEVHRSIISMTESSPHAETGGVLIGFVNEEENTAVIHKATGPGPKATCTDTLFVRDTTFVQEELDRAFAEQGSQAVYLGEWHSHLDPNPQPRRVSLNASQSPWVRI